MTVQDWRARYEVLSAETDRLHVILPALPALIAELRELRALTTPEA